MKGLLPFNLSVVIKQQSRLFKFHSNWSWDIFEVICWLSLPRNQSIRCFPKKCKPISPNSFLVWFQVMPNCSLFPSTHYWNLSQMVSIISLDSPLLSLANVCDHLWPSCCPTLMVYISFSDGLVYFAVLTWGHFLLRRKRFLFSCLHFISSLLIDQSREADHKMENYFIILNALGQLINYFHSLITWHLFTQSLTSI